MVAHLHIYHLVITIGNRNGLEVKIGTVFYFLVEQIEKNYLTLKVKL